VSNSTPPPAASPQPVKIKAEPISPPRDHHNVGHSSTIISGHNQQQQLTTITTMSSGGGGGGGGLQQQQHTTTSTLGSNLSHSHLMNSRPSSSTGHLTPTSGEWKN
jgi:MADS-box transcription enhancer factor 2A